MTGWTPQRIPITLQPHQGEALDSWIEAYARRLRCCSRELLDTIGLEDAALVRMVAILTDHEAQALAAATGLTPEALLGMTLQRFNGLAVCIDPTSRALRHPPAWRRQTGSRFCPACLREGDGRWALTWRLPWTFACPQHHRLLADTCPGCHRRVVAHRPLIHSDNTGPARCTNSVANPSRQGWRAPNCGHRLTSTLTRPLPTGGLVLAAQLHLNRILDQGAHTTDPATRQHAVQTLLELHTLAYKALAALHTGQPLPEQARQVLRECGDDLPPRRQALDSCPAHTVAVGTTIAVAAHTDTSETADELLKWIINSDRHLRRPPEPHNLLKAWRQASPELIGRILHILDSRLHTHQRLAYASTTARPRPPDATDEQIRSRAARVPTLIWPAWALRLTPTNRISHQPVTAMQATLAALLLIPGTRLTYQQATQHLGGITSRRADAVFRYLTADQTTQVLRQLTDLATRLDTGECPIDYTRRRALFPPATTSTDQAALDAVHAEHGWQPPSTLQRHIVNHHLATLLTATHSTHHTPTVRRGSADGWNPLLIALPTPIRNLIQQHARQMLKRHRIREPLTWQPRPPDPPVAWPGIDPATIDPAAFAAAVAQHRHAFNSLARICRTTGLSGAQVRLYTQTVELDLPAEDWDTLGGDQAGHLLDPDRLRRLYHDSDLALRDIAKLAVTTERTIRQTLTATGTPLAPYRPRRAPLTAQWFQQHYVNNPANLHQIAKAAGHSPNTLRWHARRLGIPFGATAPPFNPFASWPTRRMPPPAVVAACSGPRGLRYVREVLHMPARTQREAAASLGISETVLMRHRQHVENAAGIRLFHRTNPLTPTDEGKQSLRHAAAALRRLDEQNHG